MRSFLCLVVVGLIVWGCKGDPDEKCAFIPATEQIKVQLRWESLEDSLPAIKTKKQLVDFFSRRPAMRDIFFNRPAYPSDSDFINTNFQKFTHPSIDTLLMDTHRVFGDGSELKHQFESAFANFKFYYPDFQPPKIQTVITGLESDLYVSDSLIMVGLDYYLNNQSKFKVQMYDYMRKRYTKDFIVPSTMLLFGIDEKFNKFNPTDRTMLAEMVAYGKAYYFAKQMTPCVADSILIGYSRGEMAGARSNESLIWSRLVEDEVLFSTSGQAKQKFISERPKTLEVGEKCPGRIGQWVGWRMVERFQEKHPDNSLPSLMKMDNASKLFKESGYKPQIVSLQAQKKS